MAGGGRKGDLQRHQFGLAGVAHVLGWREKSLEFWTGWDRWCLRGFWMEGLFRVLLASGSPSSTSWAKGR